MPTRSARALLASVAVLLVMSAAAQDPSRAQLFAGYSYARVNIGTNFPIGEPSHAGANGFSLGAAFYFTRWFGAMVDFAGNFNTTTVSFVPAGSTQSVTGDLNSRVLTLLVGPQIRYASDRAQIFARGGVGLFHLKQEVASAALESVDNDAGVSIGGGVDLSLTDVIALRLLQADYIRSYLTPSGGQNNWRLAVGIVLNKPQDQQ